VGLPACGVGDPQLIRLGVHQVHGSQVRSGHSPHLPSTRCHGSCGSVAGRTSWCLVLTAGGLTLSCAGHRIPSLPTIHIRGGKSAPPRSTRPCAEGFTLSPSRRFAESVCNGIGIDPGAHCDRNVAGDGRMARQMFPHPPALNESSVPACGTAAGPWTVAHGSHPQRLARRPAAAAARSDVATLRPWVSPLTYRCQRCSQSTVMSEQPSAALYPRRDRHRGLRPGIRCHGVFPPFVGCPAGDLRGRAGALCGRLAGTPLLHRR
jgi:hypothetical protein